MAQQAVDGGEAAPQENSASESSKADAPQLDGPLERYPGAVLMVGPNAMVLSANSAAEPIKRYLQSETARSLRDAVDTALAGGVAEIYPLRLSNGKERKIAERSFDVVALPWADQTVALVVARETTVECLQRRALLESQRRYRDLLALSRDLMWETDDEGRFVFVAPQGGFGYEAEELTGMIGKDILVEPEKTRSPFGVRVAVVNMPIAVQHRTEGPVAVRVDARPKFSDGGEWMGVGGVFRASY